MVNKKTISEQVIEVLESLSHDELKMYIIETSENNDQFQDLFLSFFAHKNPEDTKENYSKQVRSILSNAAGRDGYIPWNQVSKAGMQVDEILTIAQRHYENKHFQTVIFICCAVMEEMTLAFQFSDDSGDDIGSCIETANELLYKTATEKLPEDIRVYLYNYCISSFEKKIFSDWDWHLDMLKIAAELISSEEEAQRITTLLDQVTESEFGKRETQLIKYSVIKNSKGEKEAEKYLIANIDNPPFRRQAIQIAINEKKYEQAIKFSLDGIRQDELKLPGLAKEWTNWLLKIAKAQNDKDRIIEYARFLFMEGFSREQDYYKLLKNTVESSRWAEFVEELLLDLSSNNRYPTTYRKAEIYISEQWWHRLLLLIQQNPSLPLIEQYEDYLSKDYSNELLTLYSKEIIKFFNNGKDRKHYKNVCTYLRRMISLGGSELVEQIVSGFRNQFPIRKALMEELDRI